MGHALGKRCASLVAFMQREIVILAIFATRREAYKVTIGRHFRPEYEELFGPFPDLPEAAIG